MSSSQQQQMNRDNELKMNKEGGMVQDWQKSLDQNLQKQNDPLLQKGIQTTSVPSQRNEQGINPHQVDVKEMQRATNQFKDQSDQDLTRFGKSQEINQQIQESNVDKDQQNLQFEKDYQFQNKGQFHLQQQEFQGQPQISGNREIGQYDKQNIGKDKDFPQKGIADQTTFVSGVQNLMNQENRGMAFSGGSAQMRDIAAADVKDLQFKATDQNQYQQQFQGSNQGFIEGAGAKSGNDKFSGQGSGQNLGESQKQREEMRPLDQSEERNEQQKLLNMKK
eukprot:403342789